MPDYRKISNHLIIALSEITDIAKEAIEEAEENIISDENNLTDLYILPPREEE